MRSIRRLAWLLLFCAGTLSHLSSRGILNPTVMPKLESLPSHFGPLSRAESYELDPLSLGSIAPDRFLYQEVLTPAGDSGLCYLAYFERGKRWSGYPHNVDVCYRSLGWSELDSRIIETPGGARLQLTDFQREDKQIRVVYWQQRPSLLPGFQTAAQHLARLGSLDALRQDIASVYFEFPVSSAPTDEEFGLAAHALILSLESLWSRK
jgi:uncharacterized protein DUF3485